MLKLGIGKLGAKKAHAEHLIVVTRWSWWQGWNIAGVDNLPTLKRAARIFVG
jgi:hypothetical protein